VSFTGKLAQLFIEFTTKGIDGVNSAIDALKNRTGQLKDSVAMLGGETEAKFRLASQLLEQTVGSKMRQAVEQNTAKLLAEAMHLRGLTVATAGAFLQTTKYAVALDVLSQKLDATKDAATSFALKTGAAFAVVSAPVGAFVRSGLAASALGQVLDFQFQRLGLTIAGLFRPEIEKVSQGLRQTLTWLQGLTAEQKESIAYGLKFAAVFTASAAAMPFVVSGLGSIVTGVKTLTLATLGLKTAAAPLTPVFVGLSVILGAVAAQTDVLDWFASARNAVEFLTSPAAKLTLEIVAGVTAFYGVVTVMPKVVAAITLLKNAVTSLNTTLIIQKALSGPTGWAQLATGAVVAAGAVYALNSALDGTAKGIGKVADRRGALAGITGGFQDADAAYKRVAEFSVKVTTGIRSVQEDIRDNTRRAADAADKTNRILDNQARPFAAGFAGRNK